jgi:hypothetical protein
VRRLDGNCEHARNPMDEERVHGWVGLGLEGDELYRRNPANAMTGWRPDLTVALYQGGLEMA